MTEDNFDTKRKANKINDLIVRSLLLIATIVSASIIILIIWQIAARGLRPLFEYYDVVVESVVDGQKITQIIPTKLNFWEFITGTSYNEPFYRIGFVIIDTLYIVFLTILIAAPIGILAALFVVKIATKRMASFLQTIIEMLAAVPSVIFGMFGFGFISQIIRFVSSNIFNKEIGLTSLATTVITLSLMILPTIASMSISALKSVNKDIEHGSLALGASETQTMYKVSLVAAKSGIFTGIILAVGRALGEATVVSLVSGNMKYGPTFNPLERTTTLTAVILRGLKETSGFDYDVRFTIGLVLIVVIIITNLVLNTIKNRMGKYET